MPWAVDGDIGVDPAAAIDWFRSRVPLTRDAYDSLGEQARSKAFTVSGLAGLDMVQETMDALDYAISQGETFESFKGRLSQRVTKAWGGASPYRLQTIFDTNLQLAYGAGRYEAASELKERRPYWGLEVVLDSRTSSVCRPLAGVVRPADDPWWSGHIPPLHFRCRTALVTYSEAQARSAGITEQAPDVPALAGFGRPPNLAQWEPDSKDYDPELWRVYAARQGTIPGVEFEQPRLGVHVNRLSAEGVSKPEQERVLRILDETGLLPYLARQPDAKRLESIELVPLGPFRPNGIYYPWSRRLEVNTARSPESFGKPLRLGLSETVSEAAPNAVEAYRRTLLHETTHHLLRTSDLEAMLKPVYERRFDGRGPWFSAYSSDSWREWFCEAHAAYGVYGVQLQSLDPELHDLVRRVRRSLKIHGSP